MCVVISFILDVGLVDAPAEVTQEEGHIRYLRLPCAVLALIFIARRILPFFSLLDRESNFVYPRINRSPLLVGHDFFISVIIYLFLRGKIPRQKV